jgi:hypothetical protein
VGGLSQSLPANASRLLKKPCFGKMTLNFIGKFAWNFGQNEFFSSLLEYTHPQNGK